MSYWRHGQGGGRLILHYSTKEDFEDWVWENRESGESHAHGQPTWYSGRLGLWLIRGCHHWDSNGREEWPMRDGLWDPRGHGPGARATIACFLL